MRAGAAGGVRIEYFVPARRHTVVITGVRTADVQHIFLDAVAMARHLVRGQRRGAHSAGNTRPRATKLLQPLD